MHETTVSRDVRYRGRIIEVRRDRVRLGDGSEAEREVVSHPGAVAVVAVSEGGGVWLVEQYRYAVGRPLLELPAGRIETGEDPAVTAARELEEETGWRPGRLRHLLSLYSSPGYSDEVIHIYQASALQPGRRGGDERGQLRARLLAVDELLELIAGGKLRDAKTVAGILGYVQLSSAG
jgi:ADP-ribose pyrophosphatase